MTQQMAPNPQQMTKYIDRGLTQQEIADAWERDTGIRVCRSTIGMALGRYGLKTRWPAQRRWPSK